MPTVYKYFGLFFLIFTRDEHSPIHVHVKSGNKMSIVEIIIDEKTNKIIMVRRRRIGNSASTANELSEKDLKTAVDFVNIKAEEIVKLWRDILANKYKGSPIIITRKIV